MFKRFQEDVVQISWHFTVEMLTKQLACFCMYCCGKKRFFEKKFSKWPVTPPFFSESLFSSTSSCEGVKKVGLFMFKIPDFSLAPCLCKQAGLDFVSAWEDLDPRTLVSGDRRHFCISVRCAAHCAGATLSLASSESKLFCGGFCGYV